eukprot:CAMPEP_0172513704 /NCGR_PEP_ID=MMETSP1066-20121228/254561_1 /TAXON_ID=671091 /ORGANISM="Coscinodiscus wailesii, Strain CCMP2513" /LENGTH=246 /DNA_ID=CAMNT_0013294085 /DNA_START=100 /DNA_END=837 /DNA_ORIENTATION=+
MARHLFSSARPMSAKNKGKPTSSICHQMPHDKISDDVDSLLSEKVIQGWTLMKLRCPVCSTSIVKSNEHNEDTTEKKIEHESMGGVLRATATVEAARDAKLLEEALKKANALNELLSSPSCDYDEDIGDEVEISHTYVDDKATCDVEGDENNVNASKKNPQPIISGVPFCVKCEAYVVTDESMLAKVTAIQDQWEEDDCDEYVRGSILLAMNLSADESAIATGDCNESTAGSSSISSPADKALAEA